jgi:hypothetical protein
VKILATVFYYFFVVMNLYAIPVYAEENLKRIAVVIGNGFYQTNDAKAIINVLKEFNFDVTSLVKIKASKKDMEDILHKFKDKLDQLRIENKKAIAIFYYSGHIVHYQDNNYLLPNDINISQEANELFTQIKDRDLALKGTLSSKAFSIENFVLPEKENAKEKIIKEKIVIMDGYSKNSSELPKGINDGLSSSGITGITRGEDIYFCSATDTAANTVTVGSKNYRNKDRNEDSPYTYKKYSPYT